MQYTVIATETREWFVRVEAASEEEAKALAADMSETEFDEVGDSAEWTIAEAYIE